MDRYYGYFTFFLGVALYCVGFKTRWRAENWIDYPTTSNTRPAPVQTGAGFFCEKLGDWT